MSKHETKEICTKEYNIILHETLMYSWPWEMEMGTLGGKEKIPI